MNHHVNFGPRAVTCTHWCANAGPFYVGYFFAFATVNAIAWPNGIAKSTVNIRGWLRFVSVGFFESLSDDTG